MSTHRIEGREGVFSSVPESIRVSSTMEIECLVCASYAGDSKCKMLLSAPETQQNWLTPEPVDIVLSAV